MGENSEMKDMGYVGAGVMRDGEREGTEPG